MRKKRVRIKFVYADIGEVLEKMSREMAKELKRIDRETMKTLMGNYYAKKRKEKKK